MDIICSAFLFGASLATPAHKNQNALVNNTMEIKLSKWRLCVHPFSRPIFSDHSIRVEEINRFQKIITFGNSLQGKSLIIVGWHISKFDVLTCQKIKIPSSTSMFGCSLRVKSNDILLKDTKLITCLRYWIPASRFLEWVFSNPAGFSYQVNKKASIKHWRKNLFLVTQYVFYD